jgi:hypothetical protein
LLDSGKYYEDYRIFRNRPTTDSREEIFSSPGLNKTGSISRGISFGNNQNVFVNSALNLQLDGKLTDDISITGSISDQNIPFQPEGNTQQLQEFDKVYVQLKSRGNFLTAGDIVMRNKPSAFLRYYKNVQGGQAEVNIKKDSSVFSTTSAGVAISKGKFASMLIAPGQADAPIEGVQGPYRLRGPNNERFIIVLSNSERVYLDGKLLVRGFDYDYIIDYNQAEISFTSNVLITAYSVIRIDFEYTDRNYSRMILNGSHYQNIGKGEVFVNFYEEKDNPRNPLIFEPSEQDKILLSQIGDTLSKAVISGADSIGFYSDRILYKDSSGIFVYSTDPNVAVWEVTFSDVGQGNGRYILSKTTANGRVFQYAGAGLGKYEPVKTVPTPRKKQMATVGLGYLVGNAGKIFGEFARSSQDLNLYSPIDDGDNGGNAFKGGYVNNGGRIRWMKNYRLITAVDYEYNSGTFTPIDRFRDANFERDWSSDAGIIADNHIINASIGLTKNAQSNFLYRISRRIREGDVNGSQHYLTVNQNLKRILFSTNVFYLSNDRPFENSDWRRAFTSLSYRSRYLVPGVAYNFDMNKVVSDTSGKIIRSAMYYEEYKAFIRNNDSLPFKFFADYAIREDKLPLNGELVNNTIARTTNGGLSKAIGENHEIASNFTYRYLQHYQTGTLKKANEETVLGRVDWNANMFKRHVRSELTLTTGTGRELRRQFIFIPVPVGEGTHFWKDLNNDGVQDLNEFFEAVYTADKKFIKSFIPTDEYIKAYTNTFSYRLDLSTPRNWRDKGKIKSVISRFSNISAWTVNKRITDTGLLARFLPLINNIDHENILSVQQSVRSTLFFNRSNPKYGLDLNYLLNENKQLLTQGYERRVNEEMKFGSRLNLKQYANIRFTLLKGTKSSESDFLMARNFNLSIWKASPELALQPRNNLRLTLSGAYSSKRNTHFNSNHEEVRFYEGGFEVKVNKVSQRTINSQVKYIRILTKFNETSLNSALRFEMLETLLPGNNYTWNITWQEMLSNGLQLSFIYEGRKSYAADAVHIGRMQVSALF